MVRSPTIGVSSGAGAAASPPCKRESPSAKRLGAVSWNSQVTPRAARSTKSGRAADRSGSLPRTSSDRAWAAARTCRSESRSREMPGCSGARDSSTLESNSEDPARSRASAPSSCTAARCRRDREENAKTPAAAASSTAAAATRATTAGANEPSNAPTQSATAPPAASRAKPRRSARPRARSRARPSSASISRRASPPRSANADSREGRSPPNSGISVGCGSCIVRAQDVGLSAGLQARKTIVV